MDERIMRTIIHVLRTLGRLASCFGMLDRTVRGPQLIRQKGNVPAMTKALENGSPERPATAIAA